MYRAHSVALHTETQNLDRMIVQGLIDNYGGTNTRECTSTFNDGPVTLHSEFCKGTAQETGTLDVTN